jgi:hypothetical protein
VRLGAGESVGTGVVEGWDGADDAVVVVVGAGLVVGAADIEGVVVGVTVGEEDGWGLMVGLGVGAGDTDGKGVGAKVAVLLLLILLLLLPSAVPDITDAAAESKQTNERTFILFLE